MDEMNGKKGKSAILRVSQNVISANAYKGQGYLSIYPYVTNNNDTNGKERLWVHEDAET